MPFVFVNQFLEMFANVGAYGRVYRERIENNLEYDNKNIVIKVVFSTLKLYRGWPPGMWHNLCIIYIRNQTSFQLTLDGEILADIIYDTSTEVPHLDRNIR